VTRASTASDEAAVLAANSAFYAAFRARDLAAMERLWARAAPVAVIHPGWPALHGRQAVLESWEGILGSPSSPDIACARARAYVLGEVAFVICNEKLPTGDLIATNVFTREDGRWLLVHHQAGPTPPLAEDPASDVIH
jgi:ketosteroid isomerase-like protein